MWISIQVQVSKKSFYTFEDIDLESPMQSYIKHRVKLWEQIRILRLESVSTVFLGTLTDFRCILHSVRFTEMKSTFIKLQNEPLQKDIGQVLLIVNNSV